METRFEELKRYVSFVEDDARLLRALRDVAEPEFPRIAQEFYERIREHIDAHAVFTGEEQIGRLRRSLQQWMHRLLSGVYDERYFENTSKIGRVHVKVGLPQRYMFTAMALVRIALGRIADERLGDRAPATREALSRILDLELAIMLESYSDDFVARLQHVERLEKADLGRSLARAEHRYKNAVELACVVIVGLDAGGGVVLFNHEAERVTGFARDEAIGQPFARLFSRDASDSPGWIADALRGRARTEPIEAPIFTKAGRVRTLSWQITATPKSEADDVDVIAVGVDVTDQLELAERTRQGERLAAVGTLAAGLAHEVRNPLNGAQLHVAYLERALTRTNADDEMIEAIGVVRDEIKRLAVLVTDFLNFARPSPLRVKPTSLRELCERARQLALATAAAGNVDLRLDLPLKDVTIEVDIEKMEQVLLNLLHNAIEANSARDDGHVTLRARRHPLEITIEVEDDGPGLESPDAPIFDAFYTTKPSGTGLGLAITHRIVTDHNGRVGVESQPGATIFRVTLPLRSDS